MMSAVEFKSFASFEHRERDMIAVYITQRQVDCDCLHASRQPEPLCVFQPWISSQNKEYDKGFDIPLRATPIGHRYETEAGVKARNTTRAPPQIRHRNIRKEPKAGACGAELWRTVSVS